MVFHCHEHMKLFQSKRGEALTIIVIIVIIILFLTWVVSVNSRECRNNSQCDNGFYCGSDFACHQIPTIEKTIVKNNLILPSFIIAIAIIIGAIIMKSGFPFRIRIEPRENKAEMPRHDPSQRMKMP